MAKCKYDIKRVPRELLESFVDKANILRTDFEDHSFTPAANAIRRAACIPLKTRDQITMELGELVRKYVAYQLLATGRRIDQLNYNGEIESGGPLFSSAVTSITEQPTEE